MARLGAPSCLCSLCTLYCAGGADSDSATIIQTKLSFSMKKIFTTKISLQSSNPTYSYPIIRLPRTLKDLAAETVTIYKTERDGSLAFFVVPKLDNLDKFVESIGQADQEPHEALIDQRSQKPMGSAGFEPATSAMSRRMDLMLNLAFSYFFALLFSLL